MLYCKYIADMSYMHYNRTYLGSQKENIICFWKEKGVKNEKKCKEKITKQCWLDQYVLGDHHAYARALPLACWINFESASLHIDSDFSPVQSKEWDDSQSASAHNLLQKCDNMIISDSKHCWYLEQKNNNTSSYYISEIGYSLEHSHTTKKQFCPLED